MSLQLSLETAVIIPIKSVFADGPGGPGPRSRPILSDLDSVSDCFGVRLGASG